MVLQLDRFSASNSLWSGSSVCVFCVSVCPFLSRPASLRIGTRFCLKCVWALSLDKNFDRLCRCWFCCCGCFETPLPVEPVLAPGIRHPDWSLPRCRYALSHPYLSWMPIAAYVWLRNCTPALRSYHLRVSPSPPHPTCASTPPFTRPARAAKSEPRRACECVCASVDLSPAV